MTLHNISKVAGGLVWLVVLFWWFRSATPFEITERIPGMDGEPMNLSLSSQAADTPSSNIGSLWEVADPPPIPSPIKASWSGFRGDNHDNVSVESVPLTDLTSGNPPKILWSIDLGEGHAAPAVRNGRVYVLDYDETSEADVLRCLSLSGGEEIWRRGYKIKVRRNHGMSRTIPAVNDSAVVTLGPLCHVMAARAITGDILWGMDLVRQFGTEAPLWYAGQCPLMEDTVAIIAVAGTATLLLGANIMTGEILWETPNKRGWKMSHSSVIPMTLCGRKMYVYCASGGIVGVAADGSDRGKILFESDEFNQSIVAPSPVAIGDDLIFITAGYAAGCALFQVTRDDGGEFSISSVKRGDVKEALASEQQTPLYHSGHLYAVLPKDAGAYRDQFVCVNKSDVSNFKWTSGHENLFGLGPYMIADNKFFILSDDGTLTAATVSDERFEKKGSIKITDGVDAWGPMAIASGRLLLRDSRRLFCVDLRK